MKKLSLCAAALALLSAGAAEAVSIDWTHIELFAISDVKTTTADIGDTGELTTFTEVRFKGEKLAALMKLMPRVMDGETDTYVPNQRMIEVYAKGEKAISLVCETTKIVKGRVLNIKHGPECTLTIIKGAQAG
ncbi:MAG: hypothetical protein EOP11_16350 [Proteobacteria bacterium]|nr:MAG: hypothetical protein EOP11_16350 [Pseudomonadota bacterium]